jgi:hypothetical protein
VSCYLNFFETNAQIPNKKHKKTIIDAKAKIGDMTINQDQSTCPVSLSPINKTVNNNANFFIIYVFCILLLLQQICIA